MPCAIQRPAAPFALAALSVMAACTPSAARTPRDGAPAVHVARDVPFTAGTAAPWEQRAHRAFSRPDRIIRLTSGGTAGFPDFDLVRNGEVIGRVTTRWRGTPGAESAPKRTLTLYRGGAAARTFELPAAERPPVVPGGPTAAQPLLHAVAAGGAPLPRAPGRSSCDAQFDDMFDAIDRFRAADAALGGCFSNATSCLSAAIAFVDSWQGLLAAEGRLGACLAVM